MVKILQSHANTVNIIHTGHLQKYSPVLLRLRKALTKQGYICFMLVLLSL